MRCQDEIPGAWGLDTICSHLHDFQPFLCTKRKGKSPTMEHVRFVVRTLLEKQQATPQATSDFLARNLSIKRYNSAFKLLWGILRFAKIEPLKAFLVRVASAIIQLHGFSKAQARNAYSAMLLVPGFDQLRFQTVLQSYKKEWNSNVEKYSYFWDPVPIVERMATTTLLWSNVQMVRERLIIVCKLFCLFRSIDIARVKRTCSMVGDLPFFLVQRKG